MLVIIENYSEQKEDVSMRKTKVYFCCLCMAIMMMLMSSSVYGATLKSVTVSKTQTYRWDLTHDGKTDSVKFVIAKNNYDMINRLQIHVNGKKAYSISDLYVYRIEVQYVRISNSKEFLYVVGRGDSNTPYIRKIFRYDTASKKLVEAADLSQYSGAVRGIKKVSGNSLTISYECGQGLVGRIKWNYIYEYNSAKKKFALKSSTAAVKCTFTYDPGDGYASYFKKNMYKTAKSITVYSDKLCAKNASVIPSGKWLTMKKVFVNKSGKMSIQFKYGTRMIWIPCDIGAHTSFEGVSRRLAGGFFG